MAEADEDGVLSERLVQIKKERAGCKAAVTRKIHSIEEQMSINLPSGIELVQDKLEELEHSWSNLRQKHQQLIELIKDDDSEMREADEYISEIADNMTALKLKATKWVEEFRHQSTDRHLRVIDDISPRDSVSQTTLSTASSSSTLYAKAKDKKEVLLARARMLRKKQELEAERKQLENQQFQLKQMEERMSLESKIEEAEIAERIYAECDGDQSTERTVSSEDELMAKPTSKRVSEPAIPRETWEIPREMREIPRDIPREKWEILSEIPSERNIRSAKPQTEADTDQIVNLQRQMMDILQLPKSELKPFDGNPLDYWTFIRGFDSTIDSVVVSDSVKLNHLLRYCTGKALSVVQCCVVMDPSVGYKEARKLLKQRYGNKYTIAKSWVDRVTQGSQINSYDGNSLQSFADDVRSCYLTLEAMGRLGEIDNRIRMVRMVEKLPVYLQGRWRRMAVKMLDDEGKYPGIEQFVKFVNAAATEVNDPVFGETQARSRDRWTAKTHKQKSVNFNVQSDTKTNQEVIQVTCYYCSGRHPLLRCETFRQISPERRLDFVRQKRLCFNCFSSQHMANNCPKPGRCSVNRCTGSHSQLLHVKATTQSLQNTEVKSAQNTHVFVEDNVCQLDGQDIQMLLCLLFQ